MGLPWWSRGYDSTHPLQGAWVRSLVLVGELKSCMLKLRPAAAKLKTKTINLGWK